MRNVAVAVAIAMSLGSMSSAIADRSIKGVYTFERSGENQNGARAADREACLADVMGLSCGAPTTDPTQRPAWRGLN